MRFELAAPASRPASAAVVRRYPDGSRVETADVPGFFWAVTPKGTRVRDSITKLVRLQPRWELAAADLCSLGHGPISGDGEVVG